MATDSLAGPISDLTKNRVLVPVVYEGTGANVNFSIIIKEAPEIQHYLAAYAKVSIYGPLTVELSGPLTSSTAVSSVVAVVPHKYTDWPTTSKHVRSLEGNVSIKDNLLSQVTSVDITHVREVSDLLQPVAQIGYPPVLVGHVHVAGGTANSAWFVTVRVPIEVSGVAHKKTW